MRDKIAGYLKRAGQAVPAEQILREVLNIRSPNAFAAETVLRGILDKDPRFQYRQGHWRLAAEPVPRSFKTAALDLQSSVSHPRFFRGAVRNSAGATSWEFTRADPVNVPDAKPLLEARLRATDCLLLVWSGRELRSWNRILRYAGLPQWEGETLAIDRLAARLLPQAASCRTPDALAPVLRLASPFELPAARAQFIEDAWRILREHIPAEQLASPSALIRWLDAGDSRVDFSRFAFGRDFLARIPESAGVYLMRDRAGEVVYVGKSGNLKRRVRSYFTTRALRDPKTVRIHSQLHSLEILTCATEVDALLLEMRMIRDFRPKINLQEAVHEKSDRYGYVRNLLILAPADDKAEIYFLKDGAFVARQSVPLGSAPSKKLCAGIRSCYFSSNRRKIAPKEEWETEIVARWVSANRKRMNLVDIDETGAFETVIARLASYLKDPDRLRNKVYYR